MVHQAQIQQVARAGLEPGTTGLQVRRADQSATLPTAYEVFYLSDVCKWVAVQLVIVAKWKALTCDAKYLAIGGVNVRRQPSLQHCRLYRSPWSDSQSCRLSITLEHFLLSSKSEIRFCIASGKSFTSTRNSKRTKDAALRDSWWNWRAAWRESWSKHRWPRPLRWLSNHFRSLQLTPHRESFRSRESSLRCENCLNIYFIFK